VLKWQVVQEVPYTRLMWLCDFCNVLPSAFWPLPTLNVKVSTFIMTHFQQMHRDFSLTRIIWTCPNIYERGGGDRTRKVSRSTSRNHDGVSQITWKSFAVHDIFM